MHVKLELPPLEAVLGSASAVAAARLAGEGPAGRLPLTADMLREEPSGNVFGLTQNVGMGWSPAALEGPQYVIVSTHGGLRSEDGSPVALGYHTGHWEIGLLVRAVAEPLRALRPRAREPRLRGHDGLPRLRLGRRRLSVLGDRGDVAGRGGGARPGTAAQRAGAVR